MSSTYFNEFARLSYSTQWEKCVRASDWLPIYKRLYSELLSFPFWYLSPSFASLIRGTRVRAAQHIPHSVASNGACKRCEYFSSSWLQRVNGYIYTPERDIIHHDIVRVPIVLFLFELFAFSRASPFERFSLLCSCRKRALDLVHVLMAKPSVRLLPTIRKKRKKQKRTKKTRRQKKKNNERACMRELTRVPMSCGQAIDRMCGNGGENSVASTATKFLALRVDTGALFPLPCPQRRALC